MNYLAAVEVDHRQQVIGSTDKLKEMLGASWHIADTVPESLETLGKAVNTRMVMPVSGAIWLTSTDMTELGGILAEIRRKVVEELNLPSTFAIVRYNDFNHGRKELEERVRSFKDAKTGEDTESIPPLAANCQILPSRAANHWFPQRLGGEQHERRALISDAAEKRFLRGNQTLNNFNGRLSGLLAGFKVPWKLEHLTEGVADQYLALVKADADGMNRILGSLDWSAFAGKLSWSGESWDLVRARARWPKGPPPPHVTPEQAMTWFSFSLDDCIWRALKTAIDSLTRRDRHPGGYFPIAPVVRAGEDTALVCRRDLALPLVTVFGHAFEQMAAGDPVLRHFTGTDSLSLSFGVLYAKQGYPFEMMWELADDLQSSAKHARAVSGAATGFVDLQWFASSGRVGIRELRRRSLTYKAGGAEYHLTSRPWTLVRAGQMLESAEKLAECLAPGRWVELETALWAGGPLTDLAYQRWLLQLDRQTRETVFHHMTQWSKQTARYPRQTPWYQEIFVGQAPGLRRPPGPPNPPTIDGRPVQCCGLLDLAELVRTFRKIPDVGRTSAGPPATPG